MYPKNMREAYKMLLDRLKVSNIVSSSNNDERAYLEYRFTCSKADMERLIQIFE